MDETVVLGPNLSLNADAPLRAAAHPSSRRLASFVRRPAALGVTLQLLPPLKHVLSARRSTGRVGSWLLLGERRRGATVA